MTTINFAEHQLFWSLAPTLEHLIQADVKTRHLDSITVWQNSVRIHTVQYTFQCKLLAGPGQRILMIASPASAAAWSRSRLEFHTPIIILIMCRGLTPDKYFYTHCSIYLGHCSLCSAKILKATRRLWYLRISVSSSCPLTVFICPFH